jgi:hypothetical protein
MKKINPILILSALGVAGALYYFLIYKKEDKSEETSENKSENKSEDKSEKTKEKPKVVVVRKNVYAKVEDTPIYNISYSIIDSKQLKRGSKYIIAQKGQLLGKLAFKRVVDGQTYLVLNSTIDNKFIMVWDKLATIK